MPAKFRILIDVDVAASDFKSGIGNYTNGMVTALAKGNSDIDIIGHYFNFLGRSKPNLPKSKNISYKQSKLFPRKLANLFRRFGIPLPYEILMRSRPDFIIFPNFLNRKTFSKIPYAVAVHDFTYIEHKEFVSKRNQQDLIKLVPASLKRASLVLVISNTMGKSLKQHYPWFKNPVIANHIPVAKPLNIKVTNAQDELAKLGINKNYILFMGNIEPRKNIEGLINAYCLLPAGLKQNLSLVLAGGKGWNNESIIKAIDNAKAAGNKIIVTGYVSDKIRHALYSEAHAVVLPSFYEGYGIPALEAMAYGKPVLLSDIPVLREVAGDAAIYCDPTDINDIAKKLEAIISNNSTRQKIIHEGSRLVESRTWESFARSIMKAVYGVTGPDNRP